MNKDYRLLGHQLQVERKTLKDAEGPTVGSVSFQEREMHCLRQMDGPGCRCEIPLS